MKPADPTLAPPALSGADLLVHLLARQGVAVVAGIPGGAILPVYDALARDGRIRHVLARHEQGACFMAQGHARASGRPGVCLASSGPGATNLLTALADAMLDSIPIVAITGQVPRAMIGTDAFQEVDTPGLTRPITKHCFMARSADELAAIVPEAFRLALSGRPGPVLIDIPKDVQTEAVELPAWPEPGVADPRPAPDAAAIATAAAMIDAAERPVLYLGGGIIHSGAAPLALALAEKAALPTTTTLMALGAMPADHGLNLGMLGMHGERATNYALAECDLLIAVGARFDDRATGKVATFCPDAKIIHIDIDAAELGKIKTPQVPIAADAALALEALLPRVAPRQRTAWLARLDALRRQHPPHRPDLDDPRSHFGLIRAVADSLAAIDPRAIVSTDVGQHQMWVAQAFPLKRPRQWLTSGGLGTMGFGLPAAMGAALAEPERTVVCFSGDGSLLMNIQELATAAEEQLNVKVILMNNDSLGLVHQQQTLFYGQRIYASRYRTTVDFPTLARGFGIAAVDLDTADDPRAVLFEALSQPGPALIHCRVDVAHHVTPMVPPGASNSEMLGH